MTEAATIDVPEAAPEIDYGIPDTFTGIDQTRHFKWFNREQFGDRKVTIIGAGATGSTFTLAFAKLGIKNIIVWDDDVVEEHNLGNQTYAPEHLGMLKVDALKDVIMRQTGTEIITHARRVGPGDGRRMTEVVCVLVDSMEGREMIARNVIPGSRAEFIIETRLGTEHSFIYAISARDIAQYNGWLGSLYSDDDVEENTEADPNGCNTAQTLWGTVLFTVGIAEWQFKYWLRGQEYAHETTVCMRPLTIDTNQFVAI